jgi:PAS domain S-box-containing protein
MSQPYKLELSLLDQVPFAVVIATVDGKIGYWNKGAEALYGWSRRDVVRRPFRSLTASRRAAQALQEALEAVTSGGRWGGRISLRHRRGDVLLAELRCSPLQSPEDDTIGVIFVAVEAASSTGRRGSDENVHIGRRIARGRNEAGLTQQELADRIGVTRRSIQAYEAGSIVPYRHLEQLAEVLGQTREWLLSDQPPRRSLKGLVADLEPDLRHLIREELLEALHEVEQTRSAQVRRLEMNAAG